MKQLSALGARRHFFRTNPRRMRALQPGELDDVQLGQPGFNYFGGEYYDNGPVVQENVHYGRYGREQFVGFDNNVSGYY